MVLHSSLLRDSVCEPMSNLPWPEQAIERLRAYHAEGYSAGMIARAMGLTRNTVIGKLHRLQIRSVPNIRFPNRGGRTVAAKSIPVPIPDSAPESRNLTLEAVSDAVCRWPSGAGPVYSYCGHVTQEGTPYCVFHQSVARPKTKASQ
jgi:GcrA cell cycle regulator